MAMAPIGPNPNPVSRGPVPPGIGGRPSDMNTLSAAGGGAFPTAQAWLADVARRNSEMAGAWASNPLPVRDPVTGRMMSGYSHASAANISSGAGIDSVLRAIESNTRHELELTRRVWTPSGGFTGSSINIPPPPGGWSAAAPAGGLPMFLRTGAGAGAGAGGGGGFVGGGGFGGRGFFGGGGTGGGGGNFGQATGAFSGGFLGAMSHFLSRSSVGMAAEIGTAAYFLPEEIGGLVGAEVGKSREAIDFIKATSQMGRAGGFGGAGLRQMFGYGAPGAGGNFDAIPEWMKLFGVTPQEAVSLVQGFGIAPTTPGQAVGIAGRLAELPFRSSLSGLSAGALQASAAQSARYGQITPDAEGILRFAQQIEPIFARATTMGLDQSALLRSMNAWLAVSASGGRGILDKGQIGEFLTRFSDLPGGRTGEFGLTVAQGLAGAADKVGRVPINTIMASSVVSGFKNEGDIKAWLDKAQPGFYDRIKGNPAYNNILQAVVGSLKQGDTLGATMAFSQLVQESPGAMNAMFTNNPMLRGMGLPPAMSLLARANVANTNIMGVSAMDVSGRQQASFAGMAGKGGALASRLQKDLGLTASGAAALVGNLMQESGLNPSIVNASSGATGYAQWLGPRKAAFEAFRRAHPELSPDEANVQFLEQEIQQGQYSAVLAQLRDPNSTLQQQVYGVRKGYEKPGEAEANDAARMSYASSLMTGRAGPRATPGENATSDTDLVKALTTQTFGGVTSLRTSGDVLGRNYEVAAAAMRAAADALDALRQGAAMQNQMLQSGGGYMPY